MGWYANYLGTIKIVPIPQKEIFESLMKNIREQLWSNCSLEPIEESTGTYEFKDNIKYGSLTSCIGSLVQIVKDLNSQMNDQYKMTGQIRMYPEDAYAAMQQNDSNLNLMIIVVDNKWFIVKDPLIKKENKVINMDGQEYIIEEELTTEDPPNLPDEESEQPDITDDGNIIKYHGQPILDENGDYNGQCGKQ